MTLYDKLIIQPPHQESFRKSTDRIRKEGGYQTEDEAAEAYVEHLSIFKNRLALLKEKQTPQFSFKDYLVYWHHNIYAPRSLKELSVAWDIMMNCLH